MLGRYKWALPCHFLPSESERDLIGKGDLELAGSLMCHKDAAAPLDHRGVPYPVNCAGEVKFELRIGGCGDHEFLWCMVIHGDRARLCYSVLAGEVVIVVVLKEASNEACRARRTDGFPCPPAATGGSRYWS